MRYDQGMKGIRNDRAGAEPDEDIQEVLGRLGSGMRGGAPVRERRDRQGGAPRGRPSKPATAEPPPKADKDPAGRPGRITLGPDVGPLPDDREGLLAILNSPKSLAQALAVLEKLGAAHGQDLIEDGTSICAQDFGPLIQSMGVGSKASTITNFALYVVPLRRALARHFGVTSPDLVLMTDLAALSYWRAIQAESASVRFLSGAIENPQWLKHVEVCERVKVAATAQYIRLIETLRQATGRTVTLDPTQDAASILRFPIEEATNPHPEPRRKASAG